MSVHHTEVMGNPEKDPLRTNMSEFSRTLEYIFIVIANIVLDECVNALLCVNQW